MDESRPVRDQPPQSAGRLVRLPDWRQVVGREQLGQGARIDVVGLALGGRDRSGPQRVGHDDTAGVGADEVGQRPGVGRSLERDRVVRAERPRKRAEVVAHRDPGQMAGRAAAVDDRDMGEVATDIETDETHGVLPPRS
jgi:hypothetical protein